MHATMRFHIDDSSPRLTGLVRMNVFARVERVKGRGKRARTETIGVAWSGWNDDPHLEQRCARLSGVGSFYWPGAITAFAAARRTMFADARVEQIVLEDISGRPIGRLYR